VSTSHVASNHGPAPSPIALQPDEGEALWFMDFLATIKASAEETGGRVAVIHHSGPKDSGSPLHVHHRESEWFYVLDGELTLKGVTKSVPLRLELNGFGPDAYGGTRAGFTATAEINRRDFGVNFNAAIETGGAVVSDKIAIHLEIEAVLAV